MWYGKKKKKLLQIIIEILKFANKLGQGQGHLHLNASLLHCLSGEISGEKKNTYES